MRRLLRDFADRAGTVLLSSHLLREVEAIADRMVVIRAGRIVAQGSKTELLGATGVVVRSLDPAALRGALTGAGVSATPAATAPCSWRPRPWTWAAWQQPRASS